MNRPDIFFRDEILTRWPDWEPTGPQMSDWEDIIRPYRECDVLGAIKDHSYSKSGNYKAPKIADVKKLLDKHRKDTPNYKREFCLQREDTREFIHFVILEDHPITDEALLFAAGRDAQQVASLYGGKWIAHAGMTGQQMVKKRNELAKAILD